MHPPCYFKPGSTSAFQPFEIVCLEHKTTRLYAEVVQTTDMTNICWVRPLMLIHQSSESAQLYQEDVLLSDLRQGSDLLLPAALFRQALDTEVIPLLAELDNQDESTYSYSKNHSTLTQLIQQICLAYPEVFKSKQM